jgi:hypothetical protein
MSPHQQKKMLAKSIAQGVQPAASALEARTVFVVNRRSRPCGIDRMMLRLVYAGSLENFLFFDGRQLLRTPCRPATIMLRGGGHIPRFHDLAVFSNMLISGQDEPRL